MKKTKERKDGNTIVQSLWIGTELSTMERLCIESFLQNGHEFHLYTYNDIKSVPSQVVIKNAREIISVEKIFKDINGSVASFSDWFRYLLLYMKGGWWVDMDIICIKYFDINADYCFGTKSDAKIIGGVLKSPAQAEYLGEILAYISVLMEKHIDIYRGEFGSVLLNKIVKNYDSEEYIKPSEIFCPINWDNIDQLIDPNNFLLNEKTFAVHLWAHIWRIKRLSKDNRYSPISLYEKLKKKYGVNDV
jgi:mannosyltransferase OCH1-like enzyme